MDSRHLRKNHGGYDGEPDSIKVLLYHRIIRNNETEDWANIAIRTTTFRRQIELLDQWGYSTITFNDYRLFLNGEINLPRKPIIITFDDAYEEIHTIALPILKEHGMTAVVFTVGDFSIRESIWDKEQGRTFRLLNENQLLELHKAGCEIGSHSLTHPRLTEISKEEVWQELLRSRMLLEILLNSPVYSFAYPYGLVSESVKKMVKDAGYNIACGAFTGPPVFGKDDFEIRRIKVMDTENSIFFWLQLQPWYSVLRWIQWKTRSLFVKGSLR